MNPRTRPLIRLIARQLVEDFYAGRLPAEPAVSTRVPAPTPVVSPRPKRPHKARLAK